MESLLRLAVTIGIVLVYRWSLHLSTPRKDVTQLEHYGYDLVVSIRRGVSMLRVWLVSLITYVPSSQVEQAWIALRDRLAAGRYGEAGT